MIDVVIHDESTLSSPQIGQVSGLKNADGKGRIDVFHLFDGVDALLMKLEMDSYTEVRTEKGLLEINYCEEGRFETSFSSYNNVILKPGDMALSSYDGIHGSKSVSHFPLGHYEGLCLELDPAKAENWIKQNAPAFNINFSSLKEKLLGNKWYTFIPAGPHCEHVFGELYEASSYMDLEYIRLKMIELLMLLVRIPQKEDNIDYYSSTQLRMVERLRDQILKKQEEYVSLQQIARENNISVSYLEKLFKRIYGVSVYRYIKEYRLEQAAVELAHSTKTVTQIAGKIGYENSSKFSESFRKRYGVMPSEYRRSAKERSKMEH